MEWGILLEETLKKARVDTLEALKTREVLTKVGTGIGGDVTRQIDVIAENVLIEALRRHVQNATVLSEESGWIKIGLGGLPLFIIDPLDGSTNVVRGYPCASISMAVAEGFHLRDVFAGAVINLMSGDLFKAERGGEVYLNTRKVEPSDVKRLEEAFIAIDLNLSRGFPSYLKRVGPIIERAAHVRFLGTDALETSFVAAGICDAFVDLRGVLRLTDFAAAAFIVEEAGGVVVDVEGKPLNVAAVLDTSPPRGSFIAACTDELCRKILSLTW